MTGQSKHLRPCFLGSIWRSECAAADAAIDEGPVLFIEHAAIAGLTAREAELIVIAAIGRSSSIRQHARSYQPTGFHCRTDVEAPHRASDRWRRTVWCAGFGSGTNGVACRTCCSISPRRSSNCKRPPPTTSPAAWLRCPRLREVLPPAETAGKADTSGLIRTMTIAVADAFSLDLIGDGEASRLVPILHRAGAQDDAPLLPPDQQRAFGEEQFNRFSSVRSLYAIGNGTYVVLSPPLRSALAEVRRLQGAPWRPSGRCWPRHVLFFGRYSATTLIARWSKMCSVRHKPSQTGSSGLDCGERAFCRGSSFPRTSGWR